MRMMTTTAYAIFYNFSFNTIKIKKIRNGMKMYTMANDVICSKVEHGGPMTAVVKNKRYIKWWRAGGAL